MPFDAPRELRWLAFIDHAHAWNHGEKEENDFTGIGLGLLWNPVPEVEARLYWGEGLQRIIESEQRSLQDNGLHFRLRVQPF